MSERFVLKTVRVGSPPDDARFSYREWAGAGADASAADSDSASALSVILLHGISSGAASWRDCAAALAHETAGSVLGQPVRMLAWDAPGYGDSSPLPQATPDAGNYADALRRWLDALCVQRCVLVGHSLGALMAAAFAQQYPARVLALLLASPAIGYGDTPDAPKIRQARLDGLQHGIATMAEKLPQRLLSARATDAQREQVRGVARQLHAAGYTQAVHMLCQENLARYTGLPALTRVCCGEDDIVTPPAQCRAYAQEAAQEAGQEAGVPFILIAQAGHACPVEQPAALAGLIKELIHESQNQIQEHA